MLILSRAMALVSLLLLLLCMGAARKNNKAGRKSPWLQKLLTGSGHGFCGIFLLLAGLAHGIAAGRRPGMISGKVAWMLLLVLVIFSLIARKRLSGPWRRLHRYLAIGACLLVAAHVICAGAGIF